jgi:hypothetical protein
MVEGPEDVGGGGAVEPNPQPPTILERLDAGALVVLEVGLDEPPERGAVDVDFRGATDHAQQSTDASFHHT